jgi:hypothetical protein
MKLSPIQILLLLVLIISVSVYFGKKRFPNELTVYTRGEVKDGSFQLDGPMLHQEEAFVGSEELFLKPEKNVKSQEPFVNGELNTSGSTVVPVTSTAFTAMTLKQKSDLLKDVQSLVRNELLAARQLEHLKKEREEEEEEEEEEDYEEHTGCGLSQSNRQGVDFNRRCNKPSENVEEEYRCPKNPDGSCPPVPDLSNYIRKDQIPCWGCSIDY